MVFNVKFADQSPDKRANVFSGRLGRAADQRCHGCFIPRQQARKKKMEESNAPLHFRSRAKEEDRCENTEAKRASQEDVDHAPHVLSRFVAPGGGKVQRSQRFFLSSPGVCFQLTNPQNKAARGGTESSGRCAGRPDTPPGSGEGPGPRWKPSPWGAGEYLLGFQILSGGAHGEEAPPEKLKIFRLSKFCNSPLRQLPLSSSRLPVFRGPERCSAKSVSRQRSPASDYLVATTKRSVQTGRDFF